MDFHQPATLADAVELPGGDHERADAVLDAMVETLETTTV